MIAATTVLATTAIAVAQSGMPRSPPEPFAAGAAASANCRDGNLPSAAGAIAGPCVAAVLKRAVFGGGCAGGAAGAGIAAGTGIGIAGAGSGAGLAAGAWAATGGAASATA